MSAQALHEPRDRAENGQPQVDRRGGTHEDEVIAVLRCRLRNECSVATPSVRSRPLVRSRVDAMSDSLPAGLAVRAGGNVVEVGCASGLREEGNG